MDSLSEKIRSDRPVRGNSSPRRGPGRPTWEPPISGESTNLLLPSPVTHSIFYVPVPPSEPRGNDMGSHQHKPLTWSNPIIKIGWRAHGTAAQTHSPQAIFFLHSTFYTNHSHNAVLSSHPAWHAMKLRAVWATLKH